MRVAVCPVRPKGELSALLGCQPSKDQRCLGHKELATVHRGDQQDDEERSEGQHPGASCGRGEVGADGRCDSGTVDKGQGSPEGAIPREDWFR